MVSSGIVVLVLFGIVSFVVGTLVCVFYQCIVKAKVNKKSGGNINSSVVSSLAVIATGSVPQRQNFSPGTYGQSGQVTPDQNYTPGTYGQSGHMSPSQQHAQSPPPRIQQEPSDQRHDQTALPTMQHRSNYGKNSYQFQDPPPSYEEIEMMAPPRY